MFHFLSDLTCKKLFIVWKRINICPPIVQQKISKALLVTNENTHIRNSFGNGGFTNATGGRSVCVTGSLSPSLYSLPLSLTFRPFSLLEWEFALALKLYLWDCTYLQLKSVIKMWNRKEINKGWKVAGIYYCDGV